MVLWDGIDKLCFFYCVTNICCFEIYANILRNVKNLILGKESLKIDNKIVKYALK